MVYDVVYKDKIIKRKGKMLYKKFLLNICRNILPCKNITFVALMKIFAKVFIFVFFGTIIASLLLGLFLNTQDFSKEPQENYNNKILFLRALADDAGGADDVGNEVNLEEVACFITEFATSYEEITKGMMFRKSLPKNYGMLFIFQSEELRQFWMQNTSIPLDIIFIGKDMRVKHIHHDAKPYDMALINSVYPAQYVLEVNAGEARNLKMGDILHKPPYN